MPSKLQAVAVSHDGHFVAASETSEEIFVWNTLEKKIDPSVETGVDRNTTSGIRFSRRFLDHRIK